MKISPPVLFFAILCVGHLPLRGEDLAVPTTSAKCGNPVFPGGIGEAVADRPLGPFKRIGKILGQDPQVATGAGHHSVIQLPGQDVHCIVYHRRPLGEKDGNHRLTCIDRMEFDDQGSIKPVTITFEGIERVRIGKQTEKSNSP